MVYVIGHKSPDLDSVAAAVSYANYKNKMAGTDIYQPAIAGELNKETKYLLNKLDLVEPELLEDAKGKELILVDHNESSQIVNGGEEAEVIEILDHHKINFSCDKPIEITVLPWGSSSSIIAKKYFDDKVEMGENLAVLLLGAVLVDTVITKSPTCTDMDKQIIDKLAEKANIPDWRGFGMEIFKVRSSVSDFEVIDIIKNDYKDFDFKAGKFGIGQIETVDLNDLANREEEIMKAMTELKEKEGYHTVILFITDIIKEGSKFLVVTEDQEKMEEALKNKLEEGKVYLEGVMSRKKQVVPMLTEIFD